jgi:hypothetical protein
MRAYRTSSNYTSNSYNAGITSSKKSTPSNTGNNRENYRSTQYSSQPKTNTFKESKKKATDAVGRSNLDNLKVAKVPSYIPGATILNAGQKFRQKTLDKNVEYFKGLKSRNPNLKYDLTDEGYKSYMKDRLDGKITASGNVNPGYGRDKDNNIQTQKVVGGQTILTKTKTPAETKVAEEKKEKEYDARVTKKKGRRKTIRTSSLGVTKTSADYSLGKKTLLGQVV